MSFETKMNGRKVPWLLLMVTFCLIEVARGQGTFKVTLSQYKENANDTASKCVKLCVKTSPSGYPRCNLNTTQDTAFVFIRSAASSLFGHPWPRDLGFKFQNWTDNSELSATVWKVPTGKIDCDGTNPTLTTYHGEASTIIPRLERFKTYDIAGDNWVLEVRTILECDNPGCLLPCVPRDNSTGHYTCHEGNKKCLPKWYGRNCLKTCALPSDPPGSYKCSRTGEKECLPNWFGENCTTFCNRTSSTYKCEEDGSRICFENWFDEDCSKFCDNSTSKTYTCSNTGKKVCETNYYGENCLTFCNNSATTYNCSETGGRICLEHWFGKDCSKFCETNAENYRCSVNGNVVCAKNQFGNNCTKFCNTSAHNYVCNLDGNKTCSRNWFGADCNKFCNTSSERYTCNDDGKRLCYVEWFGAKCEKYCDVNADTYNCDEHGNKTCLSNWYGKECENNCGEIEAIPGLIMCEIRKGATLSCPNGWKSVACDWRCRIDDMVDAALAHCKENSEIKILCSNTTQDHFTCREEENVGYVVKTKFVSKSVVVGASGALGFISCAVVLLFLSSLRRRVRKRNVVTPQIIHVETPEHFQWGIAEV